jgi:hypothetical protein
MDYIISLIVAAGLAGFAYSKLARSAGYGNAKSILPTIGIIFGVSWIIGYTLLRFVLHIG